MAAKASLRHRCKRGSSDDERGQDLAEFAIVLPFLLLIILVIIQLGILIWNYNTISNMAREGARYGIVHPESAYGAPKTCPSSVTPPFSEILEAACYLSTGLDPSITTVIVKRPAGGPLGSVTVEVGYPAPIILGKIVPGAPDAVPLQSTATMAMEQ